jgi:hypothetical protein
VGTVTFQELRSVLQGISLRESDFAAGEARVERLADFKRTVVSLDTAAEPWVAEWLLDEHVKGAMLHTAAVVNWRKEKSDGAGTTFNVKNRGAIVQRFNDWVSQVEHRLDAYERSSRSRADVELWRADLARFREDPVHNP